MMFVPGTILKFGGDHPYATYAEKGNAYYAVEGDPNETDQFATMIVLYGEKQDCGEGVLSDYDHKVMVLCNGQVGWVFSSWVDECE